MRRITPRTNPPDASSGAPRAAMGAWGNPNGLIPRSFAPLGNTSSTSHAQKNDPDASRALSAFDPKAAGIAVAQRVARAATTNETLEEVFPSADFAPGGLLSEVSWVSITALDFQVARRQAMPRNVAELVARYQRTGESILMIARSSRCSPIRLARRFISALIPESRLGKKELSDYIKNPSSIPDARLARDVAECAAAEVHFSPAAERYRRYAGLTMEFRLHRELDAAGILFESEDNLRVLGYAKTPDAVLVAPISVTVRHRSALGASSRDGKKVSEGTRTTTKVVRWIDSKAMYGDRYTHETENRDQFLEYLNRFGPGLVIYWLGAEDEESLSRVYPNVMVCSSFPEDITQILV